MTQDQKNKREFQKYARQLEGLMQNDYPKAIAKTLNNVAGMAHVEQQKTIRSKFTVRTPYTMNSFKFWKASPKADIARINAVTGTMSKYLDIHEEGGTKRPKRGSRVPIPTLAARGGSESGRIRRRYYAGSMVGPKYFTGRPAGRRLGVYERYGSKRRPRLRMIRNLERTTAHIRPTKWHQESVGKWAKQSTIFDEFSRQARAALRRAGAR